MTTPSKNHPGFAVCLFLTVLAVPSVLAQDCQDVLGQAEGDYQLGRFEQAAASLEECLAGKLKSEVKLLVLPLLAKVRLELDEIEEARLRVEDLLRLEPDYKPDPRDPPRFLSLVDEVKRESATIQISSVSKTSESLREAPATVAVITAEEIERRGYLDLEQVLHDLSGFDISTSNGQFYSHVYQRGYRSDLTKRTLVLIDGVEENDLFTTAVYLSRQFPLANVERIEVIHGPASTLYGANAFSGVINIITKEPESSLGDGEKVGGSVEVTAGAWNTRYTDVHVMGRNSNDTLTWSLAGRVYKSDEPDLSEFENWDFDPAFYARAKTAETYLKNLRFDPAAEGENRSVDQFIAAICGDNEDCVSSVNDSPYFDVERTGENAGITLNSNGLARAIRFDQENMIRGFEGRSAGYDDGTDNWLLQGKLRMSSLQLGFQVWRREEGWASWRTDQIEFGTRTWIPEQMWLYGKYTRSFGRNLALHFFSRFKEHTLDGESFQVVLRNYHRGNLGILDLVREREPFWFTQYFYRNSTQLTNELKLTYSSPERGLNLVAGVELRNSSLMVADLFSERIPNPAENGAPISGDIEGIADNRINVRDTGLYAQASYKPTEKLKLVAGGRLDDNRFLDTRGFGTVFNPRLGVIYTPGDFVVKAIYSEAFQDASNLEKFNARPNGSAVANPGLQPEKVKNTELAASWQPTEDFSLELVGYDASYSDVVQFVDVDCAEGATATRCSQFQGTGALEIQGVQLDARFHYRNFDFYGNYTYTDPFNTEFERKDEDGNVVGVGARIGDIASHQLNFGANGEFLQEKLNVDLRVNWVGDRRTGQGTDVATNPFDKIDSYFVAHLSARYEDVVPGLDLQLVVRNLLDEEYSHPGVRQADGAVRPPEFPQPGRSVFFRVSYAF